MSERFLWLWNQQQPTCTSWSARSLQVKLLIPLRSLAQAAAVIVSPGHDPRLLHDGSGTQSPLPSPTGRPPPPAPALPRLHWLFVQLSSHLRQLAVHLIELLHSHCNDGNDVAKALDMPTSTANSSPALTICPRPYGHTESWFRWYRHRHADSSTYS